MTKRLVWVCAVLFGLGFVVLWAADGPLTPLMNLGTRTDSNGYLVTTSGVYAGPETPLTPMSNLRGRTDSNGYLITSMSSTTQQLFADGTSGAPSISFASEPTLGFWRSSTNTTTAQGNLTTTGSVNVGGTASIYWTGRALFKSPADGIITLNNQASTIGAQLKVDALPTISSGTGTGVAVIAGSTPLAGAVNVGTVAPGTAIVVNFNGTAFSSAPFCQANDNSTTLLTRATATTTQLTLTSAGFTASDVVSWMCVSPK